MSADAFTKLVDSCVDDDELVVKMKEHLQQKSA
jgi:hypothetical protein